MHVNNCRLCLLMRKCVVVKQSANDQQLSNSCILSQLGAGNVMMNKLQAYMLLQRTEQSLAAH